MKILLINKFYYLKRGAEKHFFDLKKLLESKGHQVVVFSMQDERNEKTPYAKYFVSKIETEKPRFSLRGAGRVFYSFEAKKKLEKLILAEKPDIAHVHNIYHQISPSILTVLKKHKIPIAMTLHDFKILCPVYILYSKGEICEKCKTYRYWHCVTKKCAKNSYLASKLNALEMCWHKFLRIYENNVSTFIVPSEFLKNKILEWGRLPEAKINVLPHFVDCNNLTAVTPKSPVLSLQTPVGGDLPLGRDGNYILYFGSLSKEKGVRVLLEAAKILNENNNLKHEIHLAGTGPEEKALRDFVAKNYLSEKVKFCGYLTREALQEKIKNSLFVVVPSITYETFGLSALEANALGKPVVASNLGALPEIVIDKETGILFKAGDSRDLAEKISVMLVSGDSKKGERAKEIAETKYNKENYWRELEKIYENIK